MSLYFFDSHLFFSGARLKKTKKLNLLFQKNFLICSCMVLMDLNSLEDRIKYDRLNYNCISFTRFVWVININAYPSQFGVSISPYLECLLYSQEITIYYFTLKLTC